MSVTAVATKCNMTIDDLTKADYNSTSCTDLNILLNER